MTKLYGLIANLSSKFFREFWGKNLIEQEVKAYDKVIFTLNYSYQKPYAPQPSAISGRNKYNSILSPFNLLIQNGHLWGSKFPSHLLTSNRENYY